MLNHLFKDNKVQKNIKKIIEKNMVVPNKWRGNRQITWKRNQNNDSKDDQKPWKQNGENAVIN